MIFALEPKPNWVRVAQIVALFAILGPLVAGTVVFFEAVWVGLSNERYFVPLAQWPAHWLSWLTVAFQVGVPYGLVSGALFAFAAIGLGWRAMYVAVAATCAPLLLIHFIPAVGDPVWKWEAFFSVSAVIIAAITAIICWLASHRWHRSMQ